MRSLVGADGAVEGEAARKIDLGLPGPNAWEAYAVEVLPKDGRMIRLRRLSKNYDRARQRANRLWDRTGHFCVVTKLKRRVKVDVYAVHPETERCLLMHRSVGLREIHAHAVWAMNQGLGLYLATPGTKPPKRLRLTKRKERDADADAASAASNSTEGGSDA